MTFKTKQEAQTFAGALVLEGDGLPQANANPMQLASLVEHGATVGKDTFNLSRFMAWNAKHTAAMVAAARSTSGPITFKVSRKGTVSIYGLQRFPITLKVEQADRLFAKGDEYAKWRDSDPVTAWPAVPARSFRGKLIAAQDACTAKLIRGITGEVEVEGE